MKKTTTMKPKIITREILLFTGTSFSINKFCLKNSNSKKTPDLSSLEHLEKTCWAGMLSELLPELTDCPSCKTYIWHMLRGDHFLNINMGQCPAPIEKESSIDPYCFLPSAFFN